MRGRRGGPRPPPPPLLLLLWAGVFLCASQDHCQQEFFIIGFEGKDIVLSPVVNGTPMDITWKKDGNIVDRWAKDSDHSNGSLILRNMSYSHAGCYKADILRNASHDAGSDRAKNRIKIEYICNVFCLKIIKYLRPPDLNCSVHNDTIQINCIPPPEVYTLKLPVSYLWEDRGERIHHEQTVWFERNTDLRKQIACLIKIANVNVTSSIILSECILEDFNHLRETQVRTRVVWYVILFAMILAGIAVVLWRKGCIRKWTGQEHPGPAADIPLQEKPPPNESGCLLENSEEKRNEDVSEDQEPSLKEGLPLSVPEPDSGSAKNLEENEGASVTEKV